MRESYLFVFSRCGIYLRYRQPVRVWERVPSQLRLLRVQPAPIIAKIFPVFHRPLWHLVKPPCKVLLVSKMNFPVTTPMLLLTTGKFWFWKLGHIGHFDYFLVLHAQKNELHCGIFYTFINLVMNCSLLFFFAQSILKSFWIKDDFILESNISEFPKSIFNSI